MTTLKLEDLEEGAKKAGGYNPVWRLQITDDRNTVQYEGKFLDRNTADFERLADHERRLDCARTAEFKTAPRLEERYKAERNFDQLYEDFKRQRPHHFESKPVAVTSDERQTY